VTVSYPSPARRAGKTSAAVVFGFALALALTYTVAPAWTREVGLDVWNYRDAQERLQLAEQRGVEINAAQDKLLREFEFCDNVAAQVAEGALTLREAVDEVEEVCRHRPGFHTVWEDSYGAPTFRHGVARYLMSRVDLLLREEPARRAGRMTRLETEY